MARLVSLASWSWLSAFTLPAWLPVSHSPIVTNICKMFIMNSTLIVPVTKHFRRYHRRQSLLVLSSPFLSFPVVVIIHIIILSSLLFLSIATLLDVILACWFFLLGSPFLLWFFWGAIFWLLGYVLRCRTQFVVLLIAFVFVVCFPVLCHPLVALIVLPGLFYP